MISVLYRGERGGGGGECVEKQQKGRRGRRESVDDNLSTKAQHKCSISVAGIAEPVRKWVGGRGGWGVEGGWNEIET